MAKTNWSYPIITVVDEFCLSNFYHFCRERHFVTDDRVYIEVYAQKHKESAMTSYIFVAKKSGFLSYYVHAETIMSIL